MIPLLLGQLQHLLPFSDTADHKDAAYFVSASAPHPNPAKKLISPAICGHFIKLSQLLLSNIIQHHLLERQRCETA